jgi:hypothetical protein
MPLTALTETLRPRPFALSFAGRRWLGTVLAGLALLAAFALPGADARAQSATRYTQPELEQLLAPIALYPDELLAQVLMASAYPAEVQMAADWLRRNPTFKDKGDAAVRAVDSQPWDPAVRSLVAFPPALELMDANPDWTQQVGDAFIGQRAETMSAVQALRVRAQLAGNLQSGDRITVTSSAGQPIVIASASPQVVYVPSYNPTIIYGTWPYATYPPVYLPPPPGYYVGTALASGIAFGVGIAITNAIWGGFNWGGNDININVNRFNSVHVNNTQAYLRNNGRWEYDRTHRRDVPIGDRASRDRVQKAALADRDRPDYSGNDRARPARQDARPALERPQTQASPGSPQARPGAARPGIPDQGSFEGLSRPDRERPSSDRGEAAFARPSPGRPDARPAPVPGPGARPVPTARPAPGPVPAPAARPAPRPAPAARPAPRPTPAARPGGGGGVHRAR